MLRRIPAILAVTLMVLGGMCELVALAVPWARYHVTAMTTQSPQTLRGAPGLAVFGVPGGDAYLGLLLLTVVLLAAARTLPVRWRPALGSFAFLAGVLAAVVATNIGSHVATIDVRTQALGLASVRATGSPGPGILVGAAAPVLLGVGAVIGGWAASRGSARARAQEAVAASGK